MIEDWEYSQCLKTRGAVVVNIMDKCLFLLHFSCIQWQVQIYLGFKVLQGNCNTIFGIANCFLLIRVSRTQTNRQDWRSIWSFKTEFLQVVLSIIFQSDNIYSTTNNYIPENKPKEERLVNYLSKVYPKDSDSPALPARLLWMIDSRIQKGSQSGLFSLILWSQRTQKVTYLWRYGQNKKASGRFFKITYSFKTDVLKILLYPDILTLIILKLHWNQNHLKSLLTKYFPGIHPKLLSQILGAVLWFLSALRSIKWAGFSSMGELCTYELWVNYGWTMGAAQ